jgi:hypothetical protein
MGGAPHGGCEPIAQGSGHVPKGGPMSSQRPFDAPKPERRPMPTAVLLAVLATIVVVALIALL